VIDSRVKQIDPLGLSSQISKEDFVRTRPDRRRFAGKHALLMALH
jgi:hypothetical protein